jgi:3-hydroxybutyryl-CoA dehydratase
MSFKIGDEVQIEVLVTDEMVRQYAQVTGDHNPVHLDEEYAKTTRFGRRIAHGMLSAGFISNALAMHLGPGGIYLGQTLKFLLPVFIGDALLVKLKVLSIREEKGIGVIETIVVKKESGETCIKGEATIMRGDAVKVK